MKGSNPDLLPTFLFFESTTHKNESAKFRTGRGLKLLLLCKKGVQSTHQLDAL